MHGTSVAYEPAHPLHRQMAVCEGSLKGIGIELDRLERPRIE